MKLRSAVAPLTLIAAAMVVLATPAAAEKVTDFDRFRLWTGCQPTGLAVQMSKDAKAIGLTKEAVETAVRTRLRAAHLYNPTKYVGLLFVNVNVVGHDVLRNTAQKQPFNVAVNYYKLMKDVLSDVKMLAVAWDASSAGIGDSPYILSAVSGNTDKFIDEYLRVNRDACEKRTPSR